MHGTMEWWREGLRSGEGTEKEAEASEIRAALHACASAAWSVLPDDVVLRAPKRRVADARCCPAMAVARAHAPSKPNDSMAGGRLLETAVQMWLAMGAAADLPSDPELLLDEVVRVLTVAGDSVAHVVARFNASRRREAGQDLALAVRQFAVSWGSRTPGDYVRCEDRMIVPLAVDAAGRPRIVLEGSVDVSLGGLRRPRARGLLELKSSGSPARWRGEVGWYGLLATAAEGAVPDGLALWAPDHRADEGAGVLVVEANPLDAARSALTELEETLPVLALIAAGGAPARRPGLHCNYCPERATCPVSHAEELSADGWPVDLADVDDMEEWDG